jgi:hypothetical protein
VAANIANENYRLRFNMIGRPGIVNGAAFTRQRYSFDGSSGQFDISSAAGLGVNFSFDDLAEVSDHFHGDLRLACLQPGSLDNEDTVDYPGFLLRSGTSYTVILDVDGEEESGPLFLQAKLFPAAEPEPLNHLGSWRVGAGIGPIVDEDLLHGVALVALGMSSGSIEVTDLSICELPRNQKEVRLLSCTRQESGIVLLTWDNPHELEPEIPIRIVVNGQTVDTIGGSEITYELADPPAGDLEISVINYSGTPVTCSVCGNNPPVPVIDGPSSVPSGTPLIALDSSASADGDGGAQTLSRLWEVISAPPGGTTSIQDPGAVVANISVNADGEYRVQLTLTDSGCPGSVGLSEVAGHVFTVGAPPGGVQKPGDENQDGSFNISDPISVLNHLFAGTNPELPCGDKTAADPANLALLNLNGDSAINISDPVYGLNFLFGGGPPPEQGITCRPIVGCPEPANPCSG